MKTCAEIVLHPIGWVHSLEHGPREDFWGGIVSEIRLDETRFTPDALMGLSEFSHVEVFFHFHKLNEDAIVTGLRHPRENPHWPQVGILAQRGKTRPNRLGATICRLLSVEGLQLKVQGLDALDGSPVIDIKPVLMEFLPQPQEVKQPRWSHELMKDYFRT
jgi:tRNA-Thr(GGU) m(6)t(6)A37 methyltransferase TsaA